MIREAINKIKPGKSGALREEQTGKGRCDLLPLQAVGQIIRSNSLEFLDSYLKHGDVMDLKNTIWSFINIKYGNSCIAMLELSKHYEEGAEKYGERNWEKGLPISRYVSSGVRHFLKDRVGDADESHDRAFLWNMMAILHMELNRANYDPELFDLPGHEEENNDRRNHFNKR